MHDLDVELQAIRQKLAALKAQPPPDQAQNIPWSPSRYHATQRESPPIAKPTNSTAQVIAAIETLKQRSTQLGHPVYGPTQTTANALDKCPLLDAQVQKINALAQQQAVAIQGLKQLVEDIQHDLYQQGREDNPMLNEFTAFFELYPSTTIPIVQKGEIGQYDLRYLTVDFYQAERDAQVTAQTLRKRSIGPITHNIPESSHEFDIPEQPDGEGASFSLFLQSLWHSGFGWGRRVDNRAPIHHRTPFTPIDAATWFSSAAITRILVEGILQNYPALRTLAALGAISIVVVTLYRTFSHSQPNLSFSYRILVALAGLVVGGQLIR
ncbi:MAG: hypothetical protein AAF921_02570 [Cyanobacteria bacterium P01_D01_bin.44]